jgi:N utilization substance protein A
MDSQTHTALPRPELLLVADAVAREKNIDREDVFEAMEQAIQKAGRSRYGSERDIRAHIDRKTGEIRLVSYTVVVETVDNELTQIALSRAAAKHPGAKVGDVLTEVLPPVDYGRVAAQAARQVIVQKVRDAERLKQYEEYKHRVGEIINGLVKRVEFGNVIVDLGRAEAFLPRDQAIPRETYRVGDRLRALIGDVRQEPRGPQIFLSRTAPEFLVGLFKQEVPEVYNGTVQIKAVARDPGSRAKIAVVSSDSMLDPVGCCIGPKGARVRPVVEELRGERVDIIRWTGELPKLVCDAMAPAEVAKVVIDDDTHTIEVVVADDQKSLAIGRRGQNVRLASELVGWRIDISGESEESDRRNEELRKATQVFVDALDVDDVIAHLLYTEGFSYVEELLMVPLDELLSIEGFDEGLAAELQRRASIYVGETCEARRVELGVADAVAAIDGLTATMLVALGEAGVKTLDDLGDLSGDELVEIVGEGRLADEDVNAVIMAARAHWFEGGEA